MKYLRFNKVTNTGLTYNWYVGSVSEDGRWVAFASRATNLVAGDTNGKADLFLKDMTLGTITRITVNANGDQADDDSYQPLISKDGRFIAFTSDDISLATGYTNGARDVFVRYISDP